MFGNSAGNRPANGTIGNSSEESDSSHADLTMTPEKKCLEDHEPTPNNSAEDLSRPKTPHQPYFFKFSLEWMDRPQWPTKNKRLFTPCLPVASQLHVQFRRSPAKSGEFDDASESVSVSDNNRGEDTSESPSDPKKASTDLSSEDQYRISKTKDSPLPELPQLAYDHLVPSKYAGRALAEWAHIVSECDSFFARRRDEGVPCDRNVETPTLGVESFRK